MKYPPLFVLLLAAINIYGQTVTGVVIDKSTKQPINGALVTSGNSKTLTNKSGQFSFTINKFNDSLRVASFGYNSYTQTVTNLPALLHIELEPTVISLNTVTVHGDRNFKKDSIDNRIDFAKQFNYKPPRVVDAFTGNGFNRQPGELISINLLLLVEAVTKKNTPDYKFNKLLVNDEREQYIDRKFNRGIAGRITGLKGDTLAQFLISYRPAYQFALKATEYDIDVYIRESFKKFQQEGMAGTHPFGNVASNDGKSVKVN